MRKKKQPKVEHPGTETIRIRIEASYDIPKGEFDMDTFIPSRAAEAILRSHFPDEWWVEGRVVWLGKTSYRITNLSVIAGIAEKKR